MEQAFKAPVSDLGENVPEAEPTNTSPDFRLAGLLSALSLALSACGGGGGGGGGSSGPTPPPTPSLTEAQAARFLLMAQFHASDSDISSVRTLGYVEWLKQNYLAPLGQTGWEWLDARGFNTIASDRRYFAQYPGDYMIWNQLTTGTDGVRRRVALALSELMVVSLNPIDGFWPPYMIASYWDTLMRNAFGNFRTLLGEITLNPAMGLYLNTKGNLKEDIAKGRVPDENYAREVMQLFTIGLYELNNDGSYKTDLFGNKKETYTQTDISNLARVFTGYDYDMSRVTYTPVAWESYSIPSTDFAKGPMALYPARHSNLEVNALGMSIAANTPAATALSTTLDTLFNHPNVGPFFSRQMIQRLVKSNPSPAYIGRVASVFNNNGSGVRGDLKSVWTAILTDPEATSPSTESLGGKLREPILRLIQLIRTIGLTNSAYWYDLGDLSSDATELGQSPLRSPSVFNFFRPGYVPPHTSLASQGLVAPEFQIVTESTVAGYLNFIMSFIKNGRNDMNLDFSPLYSLAPDADGLLSWLNLHMCANALSANTLSTIKTALTATTVTASSTDALKLDRLRTAVFLVMASPEYLVQR